MGVVYKAEDTKLDRHVALKFLAPHLVQDKEARQRFEREARAAATLDHPHICTVHQIDESDGKTFIALAFLDGQTLSRKIDAGPLELSQAITIAAQLTDGLSAAHEKGIVHRDIKPENVMLVKGPRDAAKIMDFGLAQLAGTSKVTREGTTLGTISYMSPEQVEGRTVDHRSDLWSLGAVLYEMVSGEKPFKGEFDQAVLYSILNEGPEPLTALRAGVPQRLEQVVSKCLAKDLTERYQTAEELRIDLQSLGNSTAAEGPQAATKSPDSESRRKSPWLIPVAALAVASIAVAAWFWDRSPGSALSTTRDPSVAIMPFVNASGDPEFEYFSDGMTDELINALGKVKGLKVVGRSSVFRFKGQQYDPADVGERLHVGALLEGTVRRAGERLRITTQLISAADGFELWSDRYESEMRDVFDVQDDISRAMVGALSSELLGTVTQPIVRRPTENLDAYRLYLQGRRWESSSDAVRRRVDLLEEALRLDPEYAEAHAVLGEALVYLSILGLERASDVMERARREAYRSLSLDGALGEAHTVLGMVLYHYDWDHEGAERSFVSSLSLGPTAFSHGQYALLLANAGRYDQGVEQMHEALKLDPLSKRANLGLSYLHGVGGWFEESLRQAEKCLEIDEDWTLAHYHAANAYLGLDQPLKALESSREALRHAPNDPIFLGALGRSQAAADLRPEAEATLERLIALRSTGYSSALRIAEVYTSLGEFDRAFEWLAVAFEERDGLINEVRHPLIFERLPEDERYSALVESIGLQ